MNGQGGGYHPTLKKYRCLHLRHLNIFAQKVFLYIKIKIVKLILKYKSNYSSIYNQQIRKYLFIVLILM